MYFYDPVVAGDPNMLATAKNVVELAENRSECIAIKWGSGHVVVVGTDQVYDVLTMLEISVQNQIAGQFEEEDLSKEDSSGYWLDQSVGDYQCSLGQEHAGMGIEPKHPNDSDYMLGYSSQI